MVGWSAGTLKPNCPDSNLSCVDLASSLTCLCACLLTCVWGNKSVPLAEEFWGLCNTVHSAVSALLSEHTPGAASWVASPTGHSPVWPTSFLTGPALRFRCCNQLLQTPVTQHVSIWTSFPYPFVGKLPRSSVFKGWRLCFTGYDWEESQLLHQIPPKHHYLQIILLGPIRLQQKGDSSCLKFGKYDPDLWHLGDRAAERCRGKVGGSHCSRSRLYCTPFSSSLPEIEIQVQFLQKITPLRVRRWALLG